MLSIAYYFLQVSLCSAVMMLYYALVLRNKRFHLYNRFYLLGVAVLPWLMPLVKIEINKSQEAVSIPIQLFSVIADTNTEFEKTVADKGFQFTWETLVATLYIAVSGVLLTMLLIAMVKIYKLLKTNSCKNLDDVYLVLTQANGTPFSFFKFIFWHTDIDVTTTAGKQMLQHELTHVREKHSLDKLLLQIVLIIGWVNPIFWLLKRELETIHEFIADNKAIDNGDTAALATMLLAAAYPQQRFALTNPFFYSPIKRRIAMLTNNKHPRFSYARRLVVLPLLVTVTLLFAFRKKETKPITLSVASALENVVGTIADATNTADCLSVNGINAKLTKTYTVVIDAGHGGTDAGAPGIDGKSHEKDIALSIAKLVKAQNVNANINIVLTRDNDVFMSPVQKVDIANKANPDLFVSLHCNNQASMNMLSGNQTQSTLEGIEIFIANKEKALNYNANYEFASALSSGLISSLKSDKRIRTRKQGIWVLQTVQCPSALVECGYMDNKADLQNLTNPSYQQTLATNILKGIETYLVNKEKGVSAMVIDTVPNMQGKVEGMIVEGKDTSRIKGTFKIAENKSSAAKSDEQVMVVASGFTMKDGIEFKKGDSLIVKFITADEVHNYPVIVYNSKRLTQKEFEALHLSIGRSIDIMVLKTPNHIGKFGEAGKNGIVVVRERGENPLYVIDGKRLVDLDMKSIDPNSIKSIQILKDKKAVDKYGEEGKNGVMEIELKKSEQPFDYKKNGTMRFNGKDTFYTYVRIDAEFPGGKEAWAKYLERNLRLPEEAKIQHAPVGKYTVIVTFTVNVDGTLSNISTLNNPGFGMAEAAVNLVAKGPKWLVAVDNSKRVASVIKREIVFTVDVTSVFNSKKTLEQPVATQRVLPTELKKFQQVSPDISEVFWIGSVKHLVIRIVHKNGYIESHDLFDAKSKSMALAKYDESILLNCKFVLKAINEQKKLLKA